MERSDKTLSTDEAILGLTELLKGHVAGIEDSAEITRGHYGEYMTLISTVSDGDHKVARIVALGLVKAGANKRGVSDALRIITGVDL